MARATYKETDESTGETKIETVSVPREVVRRSLLAPSMVAHLLYSKYGLGLPFYRQEENRRRQGIELDRGTMCRCAEDVGATLGAIVIAAAKEAKETAFCLSTDATGVLIQPAPLADGGRQACRKGHFFVVLADRDHVFFEYKPKHTSDAVCEMFRGYSGSRSRSRRSRLCFFPPLSREQGKRGDARASGLSGTRCVPGAVLGECTDRLRETSADHERQYAHREG
ncbi:MAG TPA: transposase [Polyangiaceae bacterium]|nr:transposase [Polyangiaceae bacterium]